MNEAHKLVAAAALLTLGLGLAYLFGPPADSPQVVREAADLSGAQLGPPGGVAAVGPLRLHADARTSDESFAAVKRPARPTEVVAAQGVTLSAAEAEVSNDAARPAEPRWHAPSTGPEERELQPPRPASFDHEAVPLTPVAPVSPTRDRSPDDWLLAPPAIPSSYDAVSSSHDTTSSLASEHRASGFEQPQESAWWTRDTPRLQGLTASVPPPSGSSTDPAPMSGVAPIPSKPTNASLTAAIDLDSLRGKAPAAPPPVPNRPRPATAIAASIPQPSRVHLVVDGDTLARLAERYLGDARRAVEILELNREVLRNPDLLPIAVPLRIPAATDRAEPEPSQTTSTSRLVPVAAIPSSAEPQPRARLQTPAPIAASSW